MSLLRRPRRILGLVVLLAVASTCRSNAEPLRTSAKGGASGATSNAQKDAASVAKPTEAGGREATAESIVALTAQRKVWPLKPDDAERQLAALGPWKREQPVPEVLTLVGPASGTVQRSEISYSADGKKGWAFVGASFFLRGNDPAASLKTVGELIQAKLGKPRWTHRNAGGDLPSTGWKLSGRLELVLGKSPVEGEDFLVLSISEPQGGP